MRSVVNDAMDIHGGSAICMGPRNPLAHTYQALPISITVEGANMVTRNLIIFGQGSVRAHPWILKEMEAAGESDERKGLANFDAAISGHALMFIQNWARSTLGGLSERLFIRSGVRAAATERHYRRLAQLSARFSVMADLSMLRYGGALKRYEFFSALLGDLFSALYIGSAALKHFENRGARVDERPLLDWVMQDCYDQFHRAANHILANRPWGLLTPLVRLMLYPLGIPRPARNRKVEAELAQLITTDNPARTRLVEGIYQPTSEQEVAARMERAFHTVLQAQEVERKFRKVQRDLGSWEIHFEQGVQEALDRKLISQADAELLRRAHEQRLDVIQVDAFPSDYWPSTIARPGTGAQA